ncbi:hypothetical protein [Nocardia mexicana]|uniref:hypothetical protein n=1 Tax=Nocardia mexicana TaxID=279262 RepID=UPI00082E3A1C|nr:hypothetical protein [Nocardia mexicana]
MAEPFAPWWLTVDIECCAGGHGKVIARAKRARFRPARSSPAVVCGDPSQQRTFQMSRSFGRRRSSVITTGTLAGLDCRKCRWLGSVTAYRVLAGDTVPAWLSPIDLDWCDVCTRADLMIDVDLRPITIAPLASS